jgi:TolB-like protein/tetratricopeptide (TPR) repeat protein
MDTSLRTGVLEVPLVAVMPFATIGDGAQVLADGLHEDLCGALSRFRSLGVISPRSALAVATCDDAEVGRRLGASHVLRGRLSFAGERLRLSAGLVACADARQLWDERIEMEGDDIAMLRDDLVDRLASTLHARLDGMALAAARRGAGSDLATYARVLHGLHLIRRGTRTDDEVARAIFEDVLARDPANARAHAGIALSWFNEWSCQFWDRFEETSRLAYHHAHRALDLDDGDAMVHLVIAKVQLFRRAHEQASWYLDRALALCPNDADLLLQAALCEMYLGRPEIGIDHLDRMARLNPLHPNEFFCIASLVHLFARDIEGALALKRRANSSPFVDAAAFGAVTLAHAGRIDEAREELARFHEDYREKIAFRGPVEPDAPLRWLMDVNPFRRPEDVAFVREAFALLGEAAQADPPPVRSGGAARLLRTDVGWQAEFAGKRATLPDLKGLHDLRRLLERPGEEVHCLDLAERSETAFGADAALDDRARAALKARIRDLGEDLAEAEDMNDIGRAERARAEMDTLVETLSRALGLGGRGRKVGDLAERARTTVTWRLRYALRKVEAAHPALGRHLAASVRTGAFCVYQPEAAVAWSFGTAAKAVPV